MTAEELMRWICYYEIVHEHEKAAYEKNKAPASTDDGIRRKGGGRTMGERGADRPRGRPRSG